jgi:hypothetical protein
MIDSSNIFLFNIESLSQKVKASSERSRTLFYFLTLTSFLILLTSYNANFSWDRKLNANDRLILSEEIGAIPKAAIKPHIHILRNAFSNTELTDDVILDDLPKYLEICVNISEVNNEAKAALDKFILKLYEKNLIISKESYFDFFIKRQTFTIPIIGVTCFVDDIYLVGGFIIIILLTYYFFNLRRENRIVFKLYKKFMYIVIHKYSKKHIEDELNSKFGKGSWDELDKFHLILNYIEFIHDSCTQNFVLATATLDDYKKVNEPSKSMENEFELYNEDIGFKKNTTAREILKVLHLLPFLALLFVWLVDIYTAYYRWHYLSSSDVLELLIKYFIAFVMICFSLMQCIIIKKLLFDTNQMNHIMFNNLSKFKQKFREARIQETTIKN